MLDRDELDSAVAAHILTADQADRLVAHYARGPEPLADREEVRFARGFHDVFITIGLVILFAGLFLAFSSLLPDNAPRVLPSFATAAVLAWVLAEWLAARRKLALPAILLSLLFTFSFATFVAALYGNVVYGLPGLGAAGFSPDVSATTAIPPPGAADPGTFDGLMNRWSTAPSHDSIAIVFGLAAFLGGALYYWRFKVPIALTGLVAGALAAGAAILETAVPGLVSEHAAPFILLAGIISFCLAMVFDARDLARTTLNTDKAFWLHLMAAPLIMHSVLAMIRGDTGTTTEAVIIIAVVLALGFVALVVDRRALLVSGLVYLGIAIFNLLRTSNVEGETGTAAALLILGLFVLTLGSGWSSVRRILLAPFAGTELFSYVPPIRTRNA